MEKKCLEKEVSCLWDRIFLLLFIEKQKSAIETVVLSSSAGHIFTDYNKTPKQIFVFMPCALFVLGFFVVF